jgi:hypothetical protein
MNGMMVLFGAWEDCLYGLSWLVGCTSGFIEAQLIVTACMSGIRASSGSPAVHRSALT